MISLGPAGLPDRRARLALSAALLSIVISGLVLMGWAGDSDMLKRVVAGDVSMKANAALGILLAGISLALHTLNWDRPNGRLVARFFGAGAGLIGLVTLIQYPLNADFGIDQLIFTELLAADSPLSPGRMVPATALCLLLMGTSLGFGPSLSFLAIRLVLTQIALSVVALTGLGFLLGSSVPIGFIFYLQMAVPTALVLGVLGGGILLFPTQAAITGTKVSVQEENRRALIRIGTLGLAVTAVVVTFAYVIHQHEREELTLSINRELESIAHYKSQQISNWIQERRADGRVAQSKPLLIRLLEYPADADAKAELEDWMRQMLTAYQYQAVILFDAQGHRLVGETADEGAELDQYQKGIQNYLMETEVILTELHFAPMQDNIHFSVLVPIKRHQDGAAVGGLLLVINPETFLYPLIAEWPTLTSTAETLIFRQDGDQILFLNPLRHRPDAALKLRLGMDQSTLPAAMALTRAARTAVAGVDYRGAPVLAVTEVIKGTPWFMVAKIDRVEAFARLQKRTQTLFSMAALVLLVVAAGVFQIWRQHQNAVMEREYAESRKQHAETLRNNQELEARVQKRTEQLEYANQELESFSYSVSHDLRAPLRAIDGWGQVLLEDHGTTLNDDGREALGRLRAAAQRMGVLIDDLLQLSRVNRGPLALSRISPRKLIKRVREELGESAERSKIEFKVAPMPDFEVVPSLMMQVFTNLIGNAVKFSSKVAAPRIEIGHQVEEPGETVYWIKDNGVGFDQRYAHKLFGAFQRLHSVHEFPGMGIGLALTQRIIQRHGGRIWAESEVGRGATFYFTVAAAAADLPPPHHESTPIKL